MTTTYRAGVLVPGVGHCFVAVPDIARRVSVAVAWIPGGSLPVVAGLRITFGLPPEGIGVVPGAGRIRDMEHATLYVGADLVKAAVVDEQSRVVVEGKRSQGA